MRGQANLLALGAAIVILTGATATALFVASGALDTAVNDPADRQLASGLAERLLAAESPLTGSAGTLIATNMSRFDDGALAALLPADSAARITIGGDVVAAVGDADGGSRVVRLVRVVSYREVLRFPDIEANSTGSSRIAVRSADWLRIDVNGAAGTLETVWMDDRVIMHDPDGIQGSARVELDGPREISFRFDARTVTEDMVELTVYRQEITYMRVVVIADA
jgi:hypothetical protein